MYKYMNHTDAGELLQAAMDDEDRLMGEIEHILETATDRAAAEKLINEKYVPLLTKASTAARQAHATIAAEKVTEEKEERAEDEREENEDNEE
jgi:hypothetical protein